MKKTGKPQNESFLKIGAVQLENRVLAAPMAGITDKAFRIILKSLGCGMVCTEMVSDRALLFRQAKTLEICDVSGEEPPVAVQIFGSEPDTMAVAARTVVEMGVQLVDINMGCPTPKIVRNGAGAALMKEPDRAARIIEAVADAVEVPVTVKMRSGWDNEHINCCQLAKLAEAAGASAVTIHPRTREQLYSGKADWELIRQVKESINIPVIGNGDIRSARDASQMINATGCDAVMIGRGCLGNPFIFRETVHYLAYGEELPAPSLQERLAVARRHMDLACRFKGEGRALLEMRKHLSWYIKGLPNAAATRTYINQARTRAEIEEIMVEFASKLLI